MLQQTLMVLMWIGIALVAIALVFLPITLPRLLVILGDHDAWWNPIRTLPQEGEVFVFARGNPKGPFATILESIPGYQYNINTKEFEPEIGPPTTDSYLTRNGVGWVGFNRYVMMLEVHYDKWEKPEGVKDFGLVAKDRQGPAVFFQYNMATEVKAAETIGNFPVNAIITFTLQIFNPVRAFFLAGGWEVQANAGVQGVVREHISEKTIDQLRLEKVVGGSDILIKLLTNNDPAGLNERLKQFGVRIIAAVFVEFDLVGGDVNISAATKAGEVARLQGEASVTTARLGADAAVERARGIKVEYATRRDAGGEFAGTFAIAEAIPLFNGETLVLGNVPGTAVPV